MIREFTDKKLEELIKYVDPRDELDWLHQKLESIGDIPKGIALLYYKAVNTLTGNSYIENSKKRSERYYSYLIDVKNYSVTQLKVMFDLANSKDGKVAKEFENLYVGGEKLLSELKELTSIATPEGIEMVITGTSSIGDHCDSDGIIIEAKTPAISDEALIDYCKTESTYEYLQAVINVDDAICEMDFVTAVMISLFNHKDILIDNIMDSPGAPDAKNYIYENILRGTDGYDSLDDIIRTLAAKNLIDPNNESDIKYVKRLLAARAKGESGTIGGQIEYGEKFEINNGRDELTICSELDKILATNMQRMIENEELFIAYCEYLGRDPEVLRDIIHGNVSGYGVSLYKKAIADSLESICDMEYEVWPKEFKKILGELKNEETLRNKGTEAGKELEQMWGNGILSDKEAREFLKKYFKFEEVTKRDIEALRTITENRKFFKFLNKTVKNSEKAVDAIAYWLADYQGEIKMLDNMIVSAKSCGDREYIVALEQLRDTYSDKFYGTLNGLVEECASKGFDKVMSFAEDQMFGEPLVTLAETAISLAGSITGASSHYDAAQEIIAYSSICSECIRNYDTAVSLVNGGDVSYTALLNVRTTFTIMKQTLSDYYSSQISYAKGTVFSKQDSRYQAYLEYEQAKIKDMTLGQPFDAISYKEFLEQFCA